MPNVMVTLPNIGGTLCSMPQSLADAHYWSNVHAAKMRNPLKFAGVPQTRHQISAASGPKFTILWGHVAETLLFNKFFPIVYTCLSCEDISRQSCAMVPRWQIFGDFLGPAFPASHMQHILDHSVYLLVSELNNAKMTVRNINNCSEWLNFAWQVAS